jgi:hypothetical protein
MDLLPDEELERLAERDGPESLAAKALADLHAQRAKDKQVFAFLVGEYFVVGPMPDAETELHLMLVAEVARRMKGSVLDE